MDRDHPLTEVAEVLGLCFAGSVSDLRSACDVIREKNQ
jgi:hypothetical protein